jgi:transcriptional regulator with XRE-family HTH domain
MNKKQILNIKALREQRGLKQYELASMIGIGQAKISEYENGLKMPGVERLPIIAAALGVEISDLFIDDTPVPA